MENVFLIFKTRGNFVKIVLLVVFMWSSFSSSHPIDDRRIQRKDSKNTYQDQWQIMDKPEKAYDKTQTPELLTEFQLPSKIKSQRGMEPQKEVEEVIPQHYRSLFLALPPPQILKGSFDRMGDTGTKEEEKPQSPLPDHASTEPIVPRLIDLEQNGRHGHVNESTVTVSEVSKSSTKVQKNNAHTHTVTSMLYFVLLFYLV